MGARSWRACRFGRSPLSMSAHAGTTWCSVATSCGRHPTERGLSGVANPHFSPDFGCNLRMGRRSERVLASADLRRTASTTRPAPVRATLVSPTPPRFRSNSGEKCGLVSRVGSSLTEPASGLLRTKARGCRTGRGNSSPSNAGTGQTSQGYVSVVSTRDTSVVSR